MISKVVGIITSVDQNQVEVCLGAIGLSLVLLVPSAQKFVVNSEVVFFSYVHWNQEQGPVLFGFEDAAQRSTFVTLISCSGVGPKMGLAILEQLGLNGFIGAIQKQDVKQLSTVSGIGSKKAEQIIVQLKHKIDKLVEQKEFLHLGGFEHVSQVRSVLLSLNYSNFEVVQALDYIKKASIEKTANFDMALRQALSFLAKNV
jgi:holliday junction DNA helicase RuvA